jgi:hypothetical protein
MFRLICVPAISGWPDKVEKKIIQKIAQYKFYILGIQEVVNSKQLGYAPGKKESPRTVNSIPSTWCATT